MGVATLLCISVIFGSNHVAARFAFEHGSNVVTAVTFRAIFAFLFVLVLMRANGNDTDADKAADSMRAALDPDARLDELRDYTTNNHVRAGTAWGKPLQ